MLTKIKQLGYGYFHQFQLSDGIVEVETTKDDYVQLGKLNPKNPQMDNGIWKCSFERIKYDTPNGLLEDNQYAEIAERIDLSGNLCKSYKTIKLNGKVYPVKNEYIVNDELTQEGLKLIK